MTALTATTRQSVQGKSQWVKKLGVAGFTFFLVKGLLWLAAPFFFWALA